MAKTKPQAKPTTSQAKTTPTPPAKKRTWWVWTLIALLALGLYPSLSNKVDPIDWEKVRAEVAEMFAAEPTPPKETPKPKPKPAPKPKVTQRPIPASAATVGQKQAKGCGAWEKFSLLPHRSVPVYIKAGKIFQLEVDSRDKRYVIGLRPQIRDGVWGQVVLVRGKESPPPLPPAYDGKIQVFYLASPVAGKKEVPVRWRFNSHYGCR